MERLDEEARCGGIFPLITNELALSERELLLKMINLFEDMQQHTLTAGQEPPVVSIKKLTRLHRKILRLLWTCF
jgi:hypothetical protein